MDKQITGFVQSVDIPQPTAFIRSKEGGQTWKVVIPLERLQEFICASQEMTIISVPVECGREYNQSFTETFENGVLTRIPLP